MAHRFTSHRVPLVVASGGLLMAAHLLAAPPARACPPGQLEDTVTGMCWSQNGQGQAYGGPGDGPCLPGRLGNCIGTLQKSAPQNPCVAMGGEPQAQGAWPPSGCLY